MRRGSPQNINKRISFHAAGNSTRISSLAEDGSLRYVLPVVLSCSFKHFITPNQAADARRATQLSIPMSLTPVENPVHKEIWFSRAGVGSDYT